MYNEGIQTGIDNKLRNDIIARKIFLCFPTNSFVGHEEMAFEIINSISAHFKIPFTNVQVVGSAKTGFSYHKNKQFVLGESDLDIAIIDKDLFILFSEIVLRETKGFKDLSNFQRTQDGDSKFGAYTKYIVKGIFRPDLMPNCEAKKQWFKYFNKLSEKYFETFANINAGIYLNEKFFEYKQSDIVNAYLKL